MTAVRIINVSTRPDDMIDEIVRFAIHSAPPIDGTVAVRVRDRGGGYCTGSAADRKQHRMEKWAGRAPYAITAGIPTDDGIRLGPRVCWHASATRGWSADDMADRCAEALADGRTTLGRWPIYRIDHWTEAALHTMAHEAYHVAQYQRDRQSTSEVACEIFAAGVLDDWRARSMEDVVEAAARVAEGRA